jgi:poly-gamma-glutamate synthesis protein (capsule biosynthesis protein)
MERRQFLIRVANAILLMANPGLLMSEQQDNQQSGNQVTLFLCGDVMTGRGIDQVLPHSNDPRLYEPYVCDAKRYVEIAEEANGPIIQPVEFYYIWGDLLPEFQRAQVRIINLETSVTTSDQYIRGKGIHYRMHPGNVPCITAANIDCCVLANNHVLDWGYAGLSETLTTLHRANVKTAGAGGDLTQAKAPAVMDLGGKGRVLVFAFGMASSGVPSRWAATEERAGVNFLQDLSEQTVQRIARLVTAVRRSHDIVVASIHWGDNWGYEISSEEVRFAHQLIDTAGVDVIHGHSSHHVKAMEVYNNKPVFYGCGDFLNDYEGIGGYEHYRDDLSLMYFVTMGTTNRQLAGLEMVPTCIRHFQVNRASKEDALWLQRTLNREGKRFGNSVQLADSGNLILQW